MHPGSPGESRHNLQKYPAKAQHIASEQEVHLLVLCLGKKFWKISALVSLLYDDTTKWHFQNLCLRVERPTLFWLSPGCAGQHRPASIHKQVERPLLAAVAIVVDRVHRQLEHAVVVGRRR